MERKDDFEIRRKHLTDVSEEDLEKRFWELADQVVTPLVKLAEGHTSPSIERSVLLQMGFSSLEAKAIVDKVMAHGLLGKGAGHIVYRLSQLRNLDIRSAGLQLAKDKGWDEVTSYFLGGEC